MPSSSDRRHDTIARSPVVTRPPWLQVVTPCGVSSDTRTSNLCWRPGGKFAAGEWRRTPRSGAVAPVHFVPWRPGTAAADHGGVLRAASFGAARCGGSSLRISALASRMLRVTSHTEAPRVVGGIEVGAHDSRISVCTVSGWSSARWAATAAPPEWPAMWRGNLRRRGLPRRRRRRPRC